MASSSSILTYKQFKEDKQQVEGFDPNDDYEQQISLVRNPRCKRGNVSHAAFPEMYPKAKVKEPEQLLLITRSKVDVSGRRHSVSVPLIPPPNGEKFEGGYHVEKNPITGGYRLEEPGKAKPENSWNKIFGSKQIQSKKRILKTISESNDSVSPAPSYSGSGRNLRSTELSRTNPKSGELSGTDLGTGDLPGKRFSRQKASRRHSSQVSNLTKDMEKISVDEETEWVKELGGEASDGGVEGNRRKMKAKKRTNKQGFIHFLDLAVAK